ncbi:MAG: hypothetical protein V3T17_06265 [Pseudomonadales bacterium]
MSKQAVNPQQLKKNRKVILAIFGIPTVIILLSTVVYYLVETRTIDLGTVNNGELVVPPLRFTDLPLLAINGEAFDYSKPEPKWAFVIIGNRYCTGFCEKMLYIARQSNIGLAKKMHRARLIFVTTDGAISEDLRQRFDREYRGIDIVTLRRDLIQSLFADVELNPFQENTFFVVDPSGWLMMYYQIENIEQESLNTLGKAVLNDMRRLIK